MKYGLLFLISLCLIFSLKTSNALNQFQKDYNYFRAPDENGLTPFHHSIRQGNYYGFAALISTDVTRVAFKDLLSELLDFAQHELEQEQNAELIEPRNHIVVLIKAFHDEKKKMRS